MVNRGPWIPRPGQRFIMVVVVLPCNLRVNGESWSLDKNNRNNNYESDEEVL